MMKKRRRGNETGPLVVAVGQDQDQKDEVDQERENVDHVTDHVIDPPDIQGVHLLKGHQKGDLPKKDTHLLTMKATETTMM